MAGRLNIDSATLLSYSFEKQASIIIHQLMHILAYSQDFPAYEEESGYNPIYEY